MSDQTNILPPDPGNNGGKPLSEEKLMAWLDGSLSPAQQHEVEQWLAEDGMESDAMEGLRSLGPGDAKQSVKKLHQHLRKTLPGKKQSRRRLDTDYFTWIAITVVLLLIVVAYLAIRKSIG